MLLFARRSITHPLKPLLYIEWLLLLMAVLYSWVVPPHALSIIFQRDGVENSLAIGLTATNPLFLLVLLGWIGSCIWCWRRPHSHKGFIAIILGLPLLSVTLSLMPSAWVAGDWLAWVAFGAAFGVFAGLGTQILAQRSLTNKWLYTGVEFLLIWVIFLAVMEVSQLDSLHLETLLLLHVVALIRACLMFGGKSRWLAVFLLFSSYHMVSIVIGMVWGQVMGLIDRAVTLRPADIREITNVFIFNVTVVFTLATVLLILLVNALVAERRNREQLAQAHSQLRQYAQRIEDQTMLAERNRIAREIHDALGHTLTAQSIQLENALVYFRPEADRAYTFLTQARQLSQTALQEVRRSVSQLRSNFLAGKSFDQAVSDLLHEFRAVTPCELEYQGAVDKIPIEVQTVFYRILQAALTNITRHSGADRVTLEITAEPLASDSDDRLWRLRIVDNGRGFQLGQNTSGFGLQGMQERAVAIGGDWSIDSAPGQGCVVEVAVPICSWLIPSASL